MPDFDPDASSPSTAWLKRAFTGADSTNARKTVTFGDAAAVRSLPLWSFLSFVLLMAIWYVVKIGGDDGILNDRTFASQKDTWDAFLLLASEGYRNITLWEHTSASLSRVGQGMLWGTVLGVPIGLAMGLSSKLRGFFDAPVELFRPIPPLALLPLFILWFGLGDKSARNLLIFASIWIMIIAARAGVRTVNLSKIRAAYSLGASKPQILWRVILPNALPEIFTGFRVAVGVSWGTLVAAELLGTSTGLGSMIFQARNFFRIDVIIVGVIIIALLGVLMDIGVRFLEAKLIPWRGKG
ncbi:MAG: ABC transporter permease subunit [Acidimicrobiia bacterium]|nr:ABC transporter permease subunit [Acidimicrobiia bacterium]